MQLSELLETDFWGLRDQTSAPGPQGELPLTDEILKTWSSGDLFGLTQAAGMGWKPEDLLGEQYLVVSTQGGVRSPDGTPIALGYHTGHWEVGLLVQAAAKGNQVNRRSSFRGVRERPLRWQDAGYDGHV